MTAGERSLELYERRFEALSRVHEDASSDESAIDACRLQLRSKLDPVAMLTIMH